MYFNQDYSDRILGKVEDLASRVHLLKDRLTKQKVSVKLKHYWELAHVRRSFAEFKWRVEQLEEDDDSQCNRDYEHIEATWNELVRAVDALLAALPVNSLTREEAVSNHQFEEQASADHSKFEELVRLVLVLPGSQTHYLIT